MRLFTIFMLSILAWGCSATSGNVSVNANKGNLSSNSNDTPKTVSSKIETRYEGALKEFVEKHYKGWAVQGFVANKKKLLDDNLDDVETLDCSDDPCNLRLKKGKEDKVISVFAKEFERPDGTSYWLFYEPSKTEALRYRIHEERDQAYDEGIEYAKANLTHVDCQGVIDDLEAEHEALDFDEPPDYP